MSLNSSNYRSTDWKSKSKHHHTTEVAFPKTQLPPRWFPAKRILNKYKFTDLGEIQTRRVLIHYLQLVFSIIRGHYQMQMCHTSEFLTRYQLGSTWLCKALGRRPLKLQLRSITWALSQHILQDTKAQILGNAGSMVIINYTAFCCMYSSPHLSTVSLTHSQSSYDPILLSKHFQK